MSHIFISWVCLKCCDYCKCTSNGEALQLHKVYFTASHVRIHITYCESCAQYLNMQWVCIRNHHTMCIYWKLLFTAVGVVTYAVHSYTIQSYRRQQTRDVSHYSFVLWWHFYTNMYRKVGMACQIMYANRRKWRLPCSILVHPYVFFKDQVLAVYSHSSLGTRLAYILCYTDASLCTSMQHVWMY